MKPASIKRMKAPRAGSTAKACTEVSTPERTRKVPISDSEKAMMAILLAIIAFSLSLIGTFLVRSGVLTSVHAFAVDPARGAFILLMLAGFIGGSLTLYAVR